MHTVRLLIALCAVAFFIEGCKRKQPVTATAPQPEARWSKPAGTYDAFLKDRFDCIQNARTPNARAPNGTGEIINENVFVPCMSARGYTQDPNGFAPPAGEQIRFAR